MFKALTCTCCSSTDLSLLCQCRYNIIQSLQKVSCLQPLVNFVHVFTNFILKVLLHFFNTGKTTWEKIKSNDVFFKTDNRLPSRNWVQCAQTMFRHFKYNNCIFFLYFCDFSIILHRNILGQIFQTAQTNTIAKYTKLGNYLGFLFMLTVI